MASSSPDGEVVITKNTTTKVTNQCVTISVLCCHSNLLEYYRTNTILFEASCVWIQDLLLTNSQCSEQLIANHCGQTLYPVLEEENVQHTQSVLLLPFYEEIEEEGIRMSCLCSLY